jgi:hypothetical protein
MPVIYRVMTVNDSTPQVSDSARGLGVRVGGGPNTDIPTDADGNVSPNAGGMSVAPNWRDLPVHRIPIRLKTKFPPATGRDDDACWRMGEGPFVNAAVLDGLVLRIDRPTHGCVEPSQLMSLDDYRGYLVATQKHWKIDES